MRSRVGALSRAGGWGWGEGTGVRFRVGEPGELGRGVASLRVSRGGLGLEGSCPATPLQQFSPLLALACVP